MVYFASPSNMFEYLALPSNMSEYFPPPSIMSARILAALLLTVLIAAALSSNVEEETFQPSERQVRYVVSSMRNINDFALRNSEKYLNIGML